MRLNLVATKNSMNEPLLQIKNLSIDFNTTHVVNQISFALQQGETLGIVGESGSGKSVTGLSIMQLLAANGKISSGEILFQTTKNETVDLLKLQENEIRKVRGKEIAMIFQEPMTSLNPVFTCGEQIAETIILHHHLSKKEAKEKTVEWLDKVKLPNPEATFNKYPHQLSGGQKQRVMIAMAMCCHPQLIIADEPTTALDVTVQKTILELMHELQLQNNSSLIFISHDLGVIAEIADKVVVMQQGKIVEQGNVAEIFESPKHPYTKGLLACRPPLNKRLKRLPIIGDFIENENKSEINTRVSNEFSIAEIDEKLKSLEQQKNILEVKNLTVQFPSKKNFLGQPTEFLNAVDNIGFQVRQGETLGLVGESGCGKTTLGKTILRLNQPADGEILFDGKNIFDLYGADLMDFRKRMQIIFQDPYSSLNPRMTIGTAIQEPMQVHSIYSNQKEQQEKVMELLEKVNLKPEHYYRYPHEFSGGQRQRIVIARALAVQPEFIVCDECVSALDVSVQAQVLNLLTDLRNEFGFSYLFISHDLSVVNFMSDKIMVMNKGEIEELNVAAEILKNPQSNYTKKLIDAIPKGKFNFT